MKIIPIIPSPKQEVFIVIFKLGDFEWTSHENFKTYDKAYIWACSFLKEGFERQS
jgi:hypothetical protein